MLTHLKSGFSTLGCPDFTLEEAFALARKYKVNGIELRSLEGVVDLPALLKKRYGTPERMAEKITSSELAITSLDTSFKLIGSTPADRTAFLDYVPWAEALGISRLRVFDGGKNGDAGELKEADATARWWTKLRHNRGWQVDLMVETHDTFVTTPLIKTLVAAAPSCALLWDAHHTWRKGGEDPIATWSEIKEYVCHIHVKDSLSKPSARHAFTYVLPGAGDFPIAPLVKRLLEDRFEGTVCLEWERLWHPYLPPLEDALRASSEAEGWK
jgi:sugar phosphate isomerase/epimerase